MQVAPKATKREACGPTTANFYLHSPQRREDWHDFFSFFFFSFSQILQTFFFFLNVTLSPLLVQLQDVSMLCQLSVAGILSWL